MLDHPRFWSVRPNAAGPDANVPGKGGETALELAAKYGSMDASSSRNIPVAR